jgi:hypothetical protein
MDIAESVATLIQSPRTKVFLNGPPGSGKTTLGVERLRWLIQHGMPTTSILVLIPQRTLAAPYYDTLNDPALGPSGPVDVITLDGLARRVLRLFWPLIGDRAGFAHPTHPPVFLTVETAQYFMSQVVDPLIDQYGYFDAITIDRTRLLSQLLDNLNKAALIGIPLSEIPSRLQGAWTGESARRRIFDQAGECVERFRRFCLNHNLLDFSLQIETFLQHLWPQPAVHAYLFERYRHLIVDNVEEDTPVVHDLLAEWITRCDSVLIAHDQDGGYRIFLGADPASATRLAAGCDETIELTGSFIASRDVLDLGYQVGLSLRQSPRPIVGDFRQILHSREHVHRFHPQMLEWTANEITQLVSDGTPPGEIVVLAPFVSDALRFSLLEMLSERGISAHSHRPSRSLRDEPAARCLLTLAKLAHPEWQLSPPSFDVTLALAQAIEGLDLVRARLLTDVVYRFKASDERMPSDLTLGSFAQIREETRDRIGYLIGERYETLRGWLERYQAQQEDRVSENQTYLDHFLGRLFGEVLSQAGFGFHTSNQRSGGAVTGSAYSGSSPLEAGRVTADLIESARKFREALEQVPNAARMLIVSTPMEQPKPTGHFAGALFVGMVERGVVAATYVQSWRMTERDAVLVAPAYTYLMTNRPVDFQFWLDAGSRGWWERIYQPLTHPYVLRRDWKPGDRWTDEQEFQVRQESLYRLIQGLVHRCRQGIYLGISELGERGYEQRGPLLQAIQSALRRTADEAKNRPDE